VGTVNGLFSFATGDTVILTLRCDGTDRRDAEEVTCAMDCVTDGYFITARIEGKGSSNSCQLVANGPNMFHCHTISGSNSLRITVATGSLMVKKLEHGFIAGIMCQSHRISGLPTGSSTMHTQR
jgi:hypothetical protein